MRFVSSCLAAALALAMGGCWSHSGSPGVSGSLAPGLLPGAEPDQFPSTYRVPESREWAIVNATILSPNLPWMEGATVHVKSGRILAVGTDVPLPGGVQIIDAGGRWVTPGLIDTHSHIGIIPSPWDFTGDNANDPAWLTAQRIEHGVWSQDPMFERALASGVTTLQILPGSAFFVSGRSVIVKNVRAQSSGGMKFPGAPGGVKFACGENPTGGFGGGDPAVTPGTRQGGAAHFRNLLVRAQAYRHRWERWQTSAGGSAQPERDLMLEGLSEVLAGRVRVHFHCYRADDMLHMIDIAREFGFRITAFHHATEAYKIAGVLAREGIGVASWGADWFAAKAESNDGIHELLAFMQKAGAVTAIHSDDANLVQHLNQDAGRALAAGQRAGLGTTEQEAIGWLTLNGAELLGIGAETGSLEVGKAGDIVLWNTRPFSSYAMPDMVFIDGARVYDRASRPDFPRSDSELGIPRARLGAAPRMDAEAVP